MECFAKNTPDVRLKVEVIFRSPFENFYLRPGSYEMMNFDINAYQKSNLKIDVYYSTHIHPHTYIYILM